MGGDDQIPIGGGVGATGEGLGGGEGKRKRGDGDATQEGTTRDGWCGGDLCFTGLAWTGRWIHRARRSGDGRISGGLKQRGEGGKFRPGRASTQAQCELEDQTPLGEKLDFISGKVKAVLCPGWPGAAGSSK